MKSKIGILVGLVIIGAGSYFIFSSNSVSIGPGMPSNQGGIAAVNGVSTSLPAVPEAPEPASTSATSSPPISGLKNYKDIGPEQPLANPPAVVKGIYLTGWSAGSPAKVASIINLIKRTELNAVVVDIKDYSGYVSYEMDIPEVKASGAENQIRIARPNALLKLFHDNGIYVIGRITDFQDPILAKAHPEWALKSKTTGATWTDSRGLAWMDPAAEPVWDYLASIAKDAFNRGFDEVQFDYIRFASDGALGSIKYPYWDMKTPRSTIIGNYFKFLRDQFPNNKISADLFGLATVNSDDLGIGQIIQNAYKYFDFVSPMVYPSHYAPGFLGYKSPASYPYEVISYSMDHALQKLMAMGNTNSTTPTATSSATSSVATSTKPQYSPFNLGYVPNVKLRPWLQDFNLVGVAYTAAMIRQEKQAVYDTIGTSTAIDHYGGWILWDAGNNYTPGALDPKTP